MYGDVFLVLNFVIDLILLYASGLLAGARARPWRLAAAAAAGALYAFGFLLPLPAALYAPPVRLLFPAASLAIAYLPVAPPAFLRLAFWLYATSALVAGMALGLSALEARSLVSSWFVPWWSLATAAVALLLAIPRLVEAARRRLSLERLLLPVEVGIGGQRVTLTGLVDTGNRLRDPLTRSPVLVVELSALRGILPPEVTQAYTGEASAVLETARRLARLPGWSTRLRLLPFATLGKRHGLLLGFRPDFVAVWHGRERVETRDATVALCTERLAEEAAYQALVHPALVTSGSAA